MFSLNNGLAQSQLKIWDFLTWAMIFYTATVQAQNTHIHYQSSTQLKTDAAHTRIVPPNAYQALPSHLDLAPLLQWLAPNENPKNLIFSGMRRWQNDRQFIVAACFANAPVDKNHSQSTKINATIRHETSKLIIFIWG